MPVRSSLFPLPLAAAMAATLAAPLAAQTVLSGNYSVDGKLCVGVDCTGSESFGVEDLKIRDETPRLLFDDTGSSPNADWMLVTGDSYDGGANYFAISDATQGRQVLRIDYGTPASALYVDSGGDLGLGTSLPQREIHMVGGDPNTIRFEQNGSTGATPQTWDLLGDNVGFSVLDRTNGTEVMRIAPGTGTSHAFGIDAAGSAGFGTLAPDAALHVTRSDGSTQLLVEETSTTVSPRTLLNLKNSGRPEIVLANTDTGGEWSFGAGTNFILKQGAVGSASNAKTKLFEVTSTGNAILAGSLTTGGTTCGGGCDAVFAPDYPLPSIADHAAQMFALGHLPNMGPMREGQPFNLTDKFGRLLNEVEHAHIYIARLEAETSRIPALEAENAALAARLGRLEAALAALASD